jgi:ankyrin repeat protein
MSCVACLIEHEAHVNVQTDKQGTAFINAAGQDEENLLMVELLLQHGADVNMRDSVHGSVLGGAIAKGWKRVEQLLRRGATLSDPLAVPVWPTCAMHSLLCFPKRPDRKRTRE